VQNDGSPFEDAQVKGFCHQPVPVAVKHQGIAMSLRFLSRHRHEPISVADLTRAATMSRCGFTRRLHNMRGAVRGANGGPFAWMARRGCLPGQSTRKQAIADEKGCAGRDKAPTGFASMVTNLPSINLSRP
jgi:hypothetical protein